MILLLLRGPGLLLPLRGLSSEPYVRESVGRGSLGVGEASPPVGGPFCDSLGLLKDYLLLGSCERNLLLRHPDPRKATRVTQVQARIRLRVEILAAS